MAEDYRKVIGTTDGLRRGITTGTTAAAAAAAATCALLSGRSLDSIDVVLPKSTKAFSGKEINIPVNSCILTGQNSRASVVKDSGDDRDDTGGLEIFAAVTPVNLPGIILEAGEGIGIVTGSGLPVSPGRPAINPVPEKMIKSGVQRLIDRFGLPEGCAGLRIVFSAPRGREAAAKTWNSRVGVEGGVSIIGTSGVVEPRSEKAFRTSLGLVIKTAAAGRDNFIIISGYVGEKFLTAAGLDQRGWVAVGDLVGFALHHCARRRFKRIFLPLHIGKLTKIAAGLFNTHCDYGDARLETLAAAAGACGAAPEQISRLLELNLAEEAVDLLDKWELNQSFMLVAERARSRCLKYLEKAAGTGTEIPAVETAALDLRGRVLGWSGDYKSAGEICRNFM